MCFSAGASFTAGTVIAVVGIATIFKVKKPGLRVFSVIPLIFALQQFAEGCLWLTLQDGGHLIIQKISTFVFLTAAVVIWPVVVPLSTLLAEEDSKRRKVLKVLLGIGVVISLYYAFFVFISGVTPQILTCHILYVTSAPKSLEIPTFMTYLAVTLIPLFVSSVKKMKLLGSLMFVSCVVAVIFYTKTVTSVWCFFAAILSVVIYLIIREYNKA